MFGAPALAALAVASAPVPVAETARAGPVTATLSYTRTSHPELYDEFDDLRVSVARRGRVVFRSSLYERECDEGPCHPAERLRTGDTARSIALRDLDGDGEREVIVDLRLGGAHDRSYTVFLRWSPPSYAPLRWESDEPGYELRDLDGDRVPEVVASDTRFTARFAVGGAGYVRPLRISRYVRGRLVDVTHEFPGLIRRERDRFWRAYTRRQGSRRARLGLLAAWAADEYALGRRAQVRRMLGTLNRARLLREPPYALSGIPRDGRFIRELDAYLLRRGYG